MKKMAARRTLVGALVAAAGIGGVGLSAGPAHALGTSQNGWPVISQAETEAWSVGGVTFWTAPAATPRLKAFVEWFDATIEPVSAGNGDDWSWAEPSLVPPSNVAYSNHGSGTAVDLNLERHGGSGVSGSFTPDQAAAIQAKCAELGLVWGGSWTDLPDDPHIEIAG